MNNLRDELLNARIFTDSNIVELKRETTNYALCDPSVVMNLRHQKQAKGRSKSGNKHYTQLLSEAKRLVLQEEYKRLSAEKELQLINDQIENFRLEVELSKKRFHKQTSYFEVFKPNLNNLKLLSIYSPVVKQDVRYLHLKNFCNALNETSISHNIPVKTLPSSLSASEHNLPTYLNYSGSHETHNVIKNAFEKWKQYIVLEKLLDETNCCTKSWEIAAKHYEKKLSRRTWNYWYNWIQAQKVERVKQQEKHKRIVKIDKFLESVMKKSEADIKKEDYDTINLSLKLKAKKFIHSTLECSSQSSNVESAGLREKGFKQRIAAQHNIIDSQKAMLFKQMKLINTLKKKQEISSKSENNELLIDEKCNTSNKLNSQHPLSFHEGREFFKINNELNKIVDNFSEDLKAQILLIPNTSKMIRKPQKLLPPRIPRPSFLVRLEEKALEREKRWKTLQEKKRLQAEEKLQRKRASEEQQKLKEIEEKQKQIQQAKERQKLEVEAREKKYEERKRMRQLLKLAAQFYRKKLLLNWGLIPWKELLKLRQMQHYLAIVYCESKTIHYHFHIWFQFTQKVQQMKISSAFGFYKYLLQRKGMFAFKCVHYEYVMRLQVAQDYHSLYLQKSIFTSWHTYTSILHFENVRAMCKIRGYYRKKLLQRCFSSWKLFPGLMKIDRKKEERKREWRRKVQEILPDFKPIKVFPT